jgi:hypothetical protein
MNIGNHERGANSNKIQFPLAFLKAVLFHSPSNRQGLKSLANSPSRLKTTQLLILSPLQRTLAMR